MNLVNINFIPLNIQLKKIQESERSLLEQLMISYFKEIDPDKILKEGELEVLDYPFLEGYFGEEKRIPFWALSGNVIVGYALINDYIINENFAAKWSIAEFCIKPEFRKQGAGMSLAKLLFEKFSSSWEVRTSIQNVGAIAFWRNVIQKQNLILHTEEERAGELIFNFKL